MTRPRPVLAIAGNPTTEASCTRNRTKCRSGVSRHGGRSSDQSRGSTGSDSSASTANTHSCTRHSGSPGRPGRAPPGPRAYSRSASDRLCPRCAVAQPLQVGRLGVVRAVDDPQVLPSAHLQARLDQPAPARGSGWPAGLTTMPSPPAAVSSVPPAVAGRDRRLVGRCRRSRRRCGRTSSGSAATSRSAIAECQACGAVVVASRPRSPAAGTARAAPRRARRSASSSGGTRR